MAPPWFAGECSLQRLASSGLLALTGDETGPVVPHAPVADHLAALLTRIEGYGSGDLAERFDPAFAISGRAACRGFARRGRVSANGTCRLIPAGSRWIAPNLARPEDVDAVPALVDGDAADAWSALAAAAESDLEGLLERARLIGVPIGVLPEDRPAPPTAAWTTEPLPSRPAGSVRPVASRPIVVDLSSLWAGPLCARVLADCGYDVRYLDNVHRPDPTREATSWWDWLRRGQTPVRLDLRLEADRLELGRLLEAADVVIEASRPRALRQLGLDAARRRLLPGTVWLSITGYGRGGPEPHRVAFGDDAAVAGGLVAWTHQGPVFCGDALADPVTGLTAALAVLDARADGGGVLLDLSMVGAAAAVAGGEQGCTGAVRPVGPGWVLECRHGRWPVPPPPAPGARDHQPSGITV